MTTTSRNLRSAIAREVKRARKAEHELAALKLKTDALAEAVENYIGRQCSFNTLAEKLAAYREGKGKA